MAGVHIIASLPCAGDTFDMPKVIWSDSPEDHDYPAAKSYLSLLADEDEIEKIIEQYLAAPIALIKAKDVIRASELPLLGRDNFHVKRDLKKIVARKELSPLLLVRGNGSTKVPLTIADGYHRACAVYWNSEDDFIHAKIASWSAF